MLSVFNPVHIAKYHTTYLDSLGVPTDRNEYWVLVASIFSLHVRNVSYTHTCKTYSLRSLVMTRKGTLPNNSCVNHEENNIIYYYIYKYVYIYIDRYVYIYIYTCIRARINIAYICLFHCQIALYIHIIFKLFPGFPFFISMFLVRLSIWLHQRSLEV